MELDADEGRGRDAGESLLSLGTSEIAETPGPGPKSAAKPHPNPVPGSSMPTRSAEPHPGPSTGASTSKFLVKPKSGRRVTKTNSPRPVSASSKRPFEAVNMSGKSMTRSKTSDRKRSKQLRNNLLVKIGSSDSDSEVEELTKLDKEPVELIIIGSSDSDSEVEELRKRDGELKRKINTKEDLTESSPTKPQQSRSTVMQKIVLSKLSKGSPNAKCQDGMTSPCTASLAKYQSPTSTTCSSVETITDVASLQSEIKYLMQQSRMADLEKKQLLLDIEIHKGNFASQLTASQMAARAEKEELYKSLLLVMERELNCYICDEVLIQATVIDCGHTFCQFCIAEWSKKKEECPVCRKTLTRRTKHVQVNNMVVKNHEMMSEEIQTKRRLLLVEREREEGKLEKKELREEGFRLVPIAQAANSIPVPAARSVVLVGAEDPVEMPLLRRAMNLVFGE